MTMFTDNATRAMHYAQAEAANLGAANVEPEHILLGLLRVLEGSVAKSLKDLGIDMDAMRMKLLEISAKAEPAPRWSGNLSKMSLKIIDLAFQVAEELGDDHVGTPHLLTGICRHGKNAAAKIVEETGLVVETYSTRTPNCESNPRITLYSDAEAKGFAGQIIDWAKRAPKIDWDDDSYDADILHTMNAVAKVRKQMERNLLLAICLRLSSTDSDALALRLTPEQCVKVERTANLLNHN